MNNPSLSRRDFVKTTLSAAVAVAVAPAILHAEDKADAKALVIGKGDHTYEVIGNWAKLPEGKKFGNTHGVCETADGRIFVHNASPTGDAVAEFDPDGKFIKSWGAQYKQGAHGMQLRKEGNDEFLYLATTSQHVVAKTTLDGEVLMTLEYPKEAKNAKGEPCYADGGRYLPTNIAFHPTDGSFYVADGYGSNYIHRYDAKGQYLSTFGGKGAGDGQLNCPHGIWCDTRDAANPVLIVADRTNERIAVFSLDGKFTKNYKPEAAAYRHPCHFDQRGEYLVCP